MIVIYHEKACCSSAFLVFLEEITKGTSNDTFELGRACQV